jgi:hypothetical protein
MPETDTSISKYFRTGVVVDSNLLLLAIVGSYRRKLVGTFKRLAAFTAADFDLLIYFLGQFGAVVTTPMILAEVNSLANSLESHYKPGLYVAFADWAQRMAEEVPATKEIVVTDHFKRFGYTDAAIAIAAAQKYLVLTDDFALAGFLSSRGVQARNFTHLRQAAGLLP